MFFVRFAHIDTVERVGRKMKRKTILYMFTSLIFLMMSWEMQSMSTVAAGQEGVIPEEAIRLRILANSDSAKDQWLKREIRNRVNEEITIWVEQLDNIENARTVIESRLDRIEEIVTNELFKLGIDDEFTVEFDEVQFPTKLYGNIVYPAGIYESVLITIGEGKGENWWCVLFPPLCFVDFTNGDAIETDQDHQTVTEEVGEEVEVRFFVVELFDSIVDGVKSWFS